MTTRKNPMKRSGFRRKNPAAGTPITPDLPLDSLVVVEPEAALRQRAQFPLHVDAITYDRKGKRITLIARGRKITMLLALMPETNTVQMPDTTEYKGPSKDATYGG